MLLKNSDRACVLCFRKCVLGYPNTCVQKSISKGMRYLNKCSLDCSDELCKAEVQGEAMQVLQPFFKTLHTLNTLPGWHKEYDFFRVQLSNFGKHQQPTSLCTELLDFEHRNFFLATFGDRNWQDLSRRSSFFHFSKLRQRRSMQSETAFN